MATYIFDFDGTLADSFSLVCDIVTQQARYLKCKQLTIEEYPQLKDMHAKEVLRYLNVPFWRIASFVRSLRKLGNERVNEIHVFPEWLPILNQLRMHRHHIGIISSNSQHTVETVLKNHQFEGLFDFIFCDKSLFGKSRCLARLIHQQKLNRLETYYVGDEARDIEAAHANRIQAIAVGWGFNSITRLKQAKPAQLITHLEQLNHFFFQ